MKRLYPENDQVFGLIGKIIMCNKHGYWILPSIDDNGLLDFFILENILFPEAGRMFFPSHHM